MGPDVRRPQATPFGKAYGVSAIPAAFLVDGDSGRILAAGSELRGPALDATIARILAQKHR